VGESAVVVGGGLAGIAAALRLADGGRAVTLVEGRTRLGGAAFSFHRGDLSVDNGQHVFLRCCDAYRALLARLGVADRVTLQRRLDIPILRPDGQRARLRRTPGLPAPLHLAAALARFGLLSPADRLRAVRGALALRRLDPADASLDVRTLGSFLREHGQTGPIIESLWGVVATATLNLDPDEASLALAAKVFRTGLLDHADAGDVGYAAAPLGALHSEAASTALAAAGVEVLLGHRVESVEVDGRDAGGIVRTRARAGRSPERLLEGDTVVMALPPADTLAVLSELSSTPAGSAVALGSTPIVNVHVVYDRRVTDLPFAAAVNSPVQWFFDRTDTSGLARTTPGGQYLAVTVSAAAGVVDEPSRLLQERFADELQRLLPAAGRARILDTFVTRERRATFRQAAGSAALRPRPRTGLTGIWLAGAWTDTGWPDTMESAARSGIAAAEGALGAPAGTPRPRQVVSA
jgi:squalene-associated FAD-dependent desaturase